MCFPLPEDRILARGEHAGHEFVTVHNGGGYRCGYVKVSPGHPWHGKDYDEIPGDDASVHGGLTFAEADRPCAAGGDDDGWWLGFDCCHGGDAPDPTLPNDRMPPPERIFLEGLGRHGTIRTQAYVEAECRTLCEQAARVALPG